jgi:hypothetical protein
MAAGMYNSDKADALLYISSDRGGHGFDDTTQHNKKPASSMRIAGFDTSWYVVIRCSGAPAGIDEFAGSRVAAGFSWRAQLWHGYTRGYKAG